MGKGNPSIVFLELVKINEIIGTFKNMDEFDEEQYLEDIELSKGKSVIALYIPILKFSDIRDDISLSDYIVYLIILEANIKGKLFTEENAYFTALIGIGSSQIEKSLKKLVDLDLITYIDENSEKCYPNIKPLTHKQLEDYYKEDPSRKEDYFQPQVNDKREFVVNPRWLEDLQKPISLTKAERLAERKKLREEQKIIKAKEHKLNKAYKAVLNNTKIQLDRDALLTKDEVEFKEEHPIEYGMVSGVLEALTLTYTELIEYIKGRIRKEAKDKAHEEVAKVENTHTKEKDKKKSKTKK